MRIRYAIALALLSSSVTLARDANAEDPFPTRAERILSPGRSAASEDSSEAVVLNPANIANLPGADIRWAGVRCPDTQRVACGAACPSGQPVHSAGRFAPGRA